MMITTNSRNKSYSELILLPTYHERLEYLMTNSIIGKQTFGEDRILNQKFYTSNEWRKVRRDAIARDLACDLAIEGMEIDDRIIVHHINPIGIEDLEESTRFLFDLENVICMSINTHNILHYGKKQNEYVKRTPYDTVPWR